MLFTSEEWQSDPNRSYTTLSRRVAPRIATSIVNGLYIFNKKVPIKEVYLGKRNPLRQEAKENSVMDDSLVELAKKLSWSVKLVNISTGTWGLDSEDTSADKLRIPGKTEGLLNSFSFDENEAEYLSNQLPKIDIDKGDRFEFTNWFGEISIQKNGEFIEYQYKSLPETQVLTAYFNDHPIKYFIMPDKGLLINTSDYCRVMGIVDRPSGHVLGEPCLDIVSAVMFSGSNAPS
jgi:hypothetical protein